MSRPNYHQVLGVKHDASPEAIKKAFHALAQRHHPDHNPGDLNAAARFEHLHEAYEALLETFPAIANETCLPAANDLVLEFRHQCTVADNHKSIVHVEYLRRLEKKLLENIARDPELAVDVLMEIPALFRRAPHLASVAVQGTMDSLTHGKASAFTLRKKLPWETLSRAPELQAAILTAISLRGIAGPGRRRAGAKGRACDTLA